MIPSQKAPTVRDRLWIWGHPAGVYNDTFLAPLGKASHIEPVEAAQSLGLSNCIFVRYEGKPAPPFETCYPPFAKLNRVYWSLVGAEGVTSAEEREAVYRLAEKYQNIVGFILDDFFHGHVSRPPAQTIEPLEAALTPDQLRELRAKEIRGQRLPVMAVVYTGQICPQAHSHLAEVDQLCLWTWRPQDLENLESNLTAVQRLVPDTPVFLGCYMFDFANSRPLSVNWMKHQTELGRQWLREGRIAGMIFLATPIVDVGLDAVEWTRQWIVEVADEPLSG